MIADLVEDRVGPAAGRMGAIAGEQCRCDFLSFCEAGPELRRTETLADPIPQMGDFLGATRCFESWKLTQASVLGSIWRADGEYGFRLSPWVIPGDKVEELLSDGRSDEASDLGDVLPQR